MHRLTPLALLASLGACAADEPVAEPLPQPVDVVWAKTIRPGDVIVLVPGTGSVDYLATPIEAMGAERPVVDVLADELVRSDAVVFEQAIAAAHRAGISNDALERGDVKLLLWGAGFTKVTAFEYVSYERLHVPIEILGGTNSCASGLIVDNYLNYTKWSADTDARDLYTRLATWLTDHPSEAPRNAVVMSHSWGGAVAEYLTLELDKGLADLPALPGNTQMPFTVAAGVPSFIVEYDYPGPTVRDFSRRSGETTLLYEIDRPDDPVHNLTFEGDYGGHHYEIAFGEEFRGVYGITTNELSCHTVPGPCAE